MNKIDTMHQRLLDLYDLPYDTNDNEFIQMAVNQEIEKRQAKLIEDYKKILNNEKI